MIVGTLGILASIPGQTAGVSPFKQPLLEALQLTDIQLSFAYMVGTLVSGLLIPYSGQFCDKYGARLMVVIILMLFSFSLLFMSSCASVYQWLTSRLQGVGRASDAMIGTAIITLGFFLIRFFGQGMLTIVSRTMIANWFNRKRGMVTAISGILTTLAFNGAPAILNLGVGKLGWEGTFEFLGVAYFCVLTAVFWLFSRDNPEASHLNMDGEVMPEDEDELSEFSEFKIYHEFTGYEALQTWAFWLFTGALALHGFVMTAIYFHASDIALAAGIELDFFYALLWPVAVITIIIGFFLGWLNNRIRLKYILIGYVLCLVFLPMTVIFIEHSVGQISFVAITGLAGACFGNLFSVTCPRFFGRLHLGRINGYLTSVLVICSALGPIFYSFSQALLDSYEPALWACAAVSCILLLLAYKGDNPQKRYLVRG